MKLKNFLEKRKMTLKLRRKIGYSGRSLVVRLPKDVTNNMRICRGDNVDLYTYRNKLIIEKV